MVFVIPVDGVLCGCLSVGNTGYVVKGRGLRFAGTSRLGSPFSYRPGLVSCSGIPRDGLRK